MARIRTNNYDVQVTSLENMADGAKKHADNPKVKTTLVEKQIRVDKNEVEDLREKYNQLVADTEKAYDNFSAKYRSNVKVLARDTRLAKGIFGRSAPELKDFGIKPEKK
jgi:hypothetical protein